MISGGKTNSNVEEKIFVDRWLYQNNMGCVMMVYDLDCIKRLIKRKYKTKYYVI
jgi:hypothetical protein